MTSSVTRFKSSEASMEVLYKQDKNNNTRVWMIHVEDNGEDATIVWQSGVLGGALISHSRIITSGKNLGKKNETSYLSQAIKEMNAMISHKIDIEHYTANVTNDNRQDDGHKHMLAHDYKKYKNKIVFPCFVQPKIDGIRAKYIDGTLYTRNDKIIHNFMSIKKALLNYSDEYLIFDGEIYSYILPMFNIISGLARRGHSSGSALTSSREALEPKGRSTGKKDKEIKNGDSFVFIIYDIINLPRETYETRYSRLLDMNFHPPLVLIENHIAKNEQEVLEYHKKYVTAGYEGTILRNINSFYEGCRSYHLQKYKNIETDEYQVKKIAEGIGSSKGKVIYWVTGKNGVLFKVNPKGTSEEKKYIYAHAEEFIGKWITIQFQELNENGIPRFATTPYGGLADFREDINMPDT